MTTILLLLAGIYVIIFGGLIWSACTSAALKPCGCSGPFLIMQIYEDDLGESPLHCWTPEEGPRLVMGKRHTCKKKCCRCGRIQLSVGTFPPPEEKSFS